MALINRFSRLLTADFHALLDRVEEPEVLIKQALREMQDSLTDMRIHAEELRIDIEHRNQSIDAYTSKRIDIDQEIDLCFAAGKEALARNATRRKLEMEREIERATATLVSAKRALTELETKISQHDAELEDLRTKLATRGAHRRCGQSHENGFGVRPIAEEDLEIAFLREKQRRDIK